MPFTPAGVLTRLPCPSVWAAGRAGGEGDVQVGITNMDTITPTSTPAANTKFVRRRDGDCLGAILPGKRPLRTECHVHLNRVFRFSSAWRAPGGSLQCLLSSSSIVPKPIPSDRVATLRVHVLELRATDDSKQRFFVVEPPFSCTRSTQRCSHRCLWTRPACHQG